MNADLGQMESLLDPYCTCEPFEALNEVAACIHPEHVPGARFDLNWDHTDALMTGHYLTLGPPGKDGAQHANHLHSLLFVGDWGRVIARVDSAKQASLLVTGSALNQQLTATAYSVSRPATASETQTEQHDAGVDLRATGFGRCVGLRWQRGGMVVLNMMNRLGDHLAVGAECVLVPHQQTRIYSYGLLFAPHPTLDASLTISQYNHALLAAARWRPNGETTVTASVSHMRAPTTRLLGDVCVERTTGDATMRASMTTDGTFTSAVETTLRQISGRFLVSLQANPFVGTYSWGFSLQLFR